MRLLARRVQIRICCSTLLLSIPMQAAKCKNKDSNDLVVIAFRDRLSTLQFDDHCLGRIHQAERLANFQARVGSLFVPS